MALNIAIMNRQDYLAVVKADLAAHGLRRWNLIESIRHPEVRVQRSIRRVEYLSTVRGVVGRSLLLIAKLRLLIDSEKSGVQLPAGVAGPGLSIAHYGSIVINSKSRIGKYCRIHSATNIGSTPSGVPVIGDYVYIGPGAVIYGPVTVGDRAVIGANAVVNKDVPAGVTVAGAPARIISHQGSEAIMPAWIDVPRPEVSGL